MLDTRLDVPYGKAPAQRFDLFLPSGAASDRPLLVFVHGGAWRSGDKADVRDTLITRLAERTGHAVAAVNYRLSAKTPADRVDPPVTHPDHILDLIAALQCLVEWTDDGRRRYDASRIVLIGHSCAAFMITSLWLAPSPSFDPSPVFSVPPSLRRRIVGLACLEPITDLAELVDEHPGYPAYFINEAFGTSADEWARHSPTRWGLPSVAECADRVDVLIVHSREDELLSTWQPRVLGDALAKLFSPDGGIQLGNEVDRTGRAQTVEGPRGSVTCDFDSVHGASIACSMPLTEPGEHDPVLEGAPLVDLLAAFVARVRGA